ncbi:unnamed protein product [Aureobasidium vineae]|uniref:Uncharacterized protein n=1 Tax=Aureobasidium vineae TaxID=2773715 RepID=A0A9N8JG80_9PEZI|nr:unnamed protein product [Aureobasidium vineae]
MADWQELLTTVRDVYQNVSELYGLIKDHEQDLIVIEKAGSLMEDTETNLSFLNGCIQKYGNDTQLTDQIAGFSRSRVSQSPNTTSSLNGTPSDVATKSHGNLEEDEMKRQVQDTVRHLITEMVGLLARKSCCSTGHHVDCGMNHAHQQSGKQQLSVDDSDEFDIL